MKTVKKLLCLTLAVLLCAAAFSACESGPNIGTGNPDITISSVEPKNPENSHIDLNNFDVRLVYLTSIYSQVVYAADGSYFMADGWIYVADTLLAKMRPDGTEKEYLPEEVSRFCLYNATYHDGWIYFIDNRYMYIDTLPPPGTNENLLRMRPDGTDLQECIKGVYTFEICGEWVFYQSGYSLYTVKIDDWGKSYTLYKSGKQSTWNMRTWIIYGDYIFYSINETNGGSGQYNTKMYRINLNGVNPVLLKESVSIIYDPRFIYDGCLYFSSYQFGIGDIIYCANLDGSNTATVIEPEHYVLLRTLKIYDGWLYYDYSWNEYSNSYFVGTNESIRKVKLDGTDDQLVTEDAENYKFHESDKDYMLWDSYEYTEFNNDGYGTFRVQRLYVQPSNKSIEKIMIFETKGVSMILSQKTDTWESIQGYYIYNGSICILVKTWGNGQ